MFISRFLASAAVLMTLAGCASKLPTCDGNSRRPINPPSQPAVINTAPAPTPLDGGDKP